MPNTSESKQHADIVEADTQRLKARIQRHYDVTSDQFLKVWGEHIHHGYFKSQADTPEQAQLNQVLRLAESSGVSAGSRVLDVGCGIGGTARYLARERGCKVTAVTNSRRQVEIARELTATEVAKARGSPTPKPQLSNNSNSSGSEFVEYPSSPSLAAAGAVRVLNLDVEQMREHLAGESFDCVWISEVVFHLHARKLFFDSAFALLDHGGCLVIADIFRSAADPASGPEPKRTQKELASIRRNHLCPQLGTVDEYTQMAREAGFHPRHEPIDITENVVKTWDTPLPIGSMLYIISRGRDTIGYWRGMRSMKRAYAHATALYAVLCFEKP
ncbi:S-adenosyl-L-methionine-dependent methyltransferase [Astrocystis sublimbata]|nr:S-adenosyl-L-methionine-dependent methyltransferase [Astrocystis sublimbata]